MKKDLLQRSIYPLIFLLLISFQLHSQYFITGQDPASTQWDQIKTKYFQIIYPRGYSEMAQYYINVLSLSSPHVTEAYLNMDKQKRISIILHNQITTSNAMVPVAPMRADFFEMPSQDIYPQIWQNQLSLHEYRHVVHINAMRQGLTKGLYYVFGEQALAAVLGIWLPFWFIEGDAVYSETIFSNSGRGRSPDFIYPLQAQVLDRKIYKYDKAVFGSFKDFVPNHYQLGYQLVTKGVQNYGIEMWKFTIDRVARRPYYLVPFTTSIKKQTGSFKVQYYNQTLKSLRNEWWVTDKLQIDSATNILSPDQKFFTNYLFPNALDDGSVILEKTGLDDVNRFVIVNPDGEEERLFTPGFDFKESLSVAGNVICWNERSYDPRWDNRNYSVIKLYNFKTKKLTKLTSKSRYFAPALSAKGDRIATVHVSNQSKYSIHILDAKTGEIIKEIKTDDNLFFMTPHWSDKDDFIVATVLGKDGKSIIQIDAKTWDINYLLPFSFREIGWPVMHGEWVVYTGSYEGKDKLYAIHTSTKKIYHVFEPRFGAKYASFSKDGKRLYFSYYTSDGYKLASTDFEPAKGELIWPSKINFQYLADKLLKPQTFNLDDTVVPSKDYPSKSYSKAGHLFNLHSWAPLSVDVDNYTINPGVTLLSQNVLSTSVATLGYVYDPNEGTSKIQFGFDYYGFYPIIGFSVDYGGRKTMHTPTDGDPVQLKWRETDISLNFRIPFKFTHSKWIQGIIPSASFTQKFLKMDSGSKYSFREDDIIVPTYRFYGYNQYKMSPKDLYPHWGQNIDLIYRNTPFSTKVSTQAALIGWAYFPGFIRHQGLRVYGGYQKTTTGNYSFSNLLAIPRGYSSVSYPEYFSIRSDYAFPIAYPDWNVPGAFYLKRIYSKVFYDYLQGYDEGSVQDLSSTGAELYTDWNFLSVLLNVRLGVRMSHRFSDNTQQYEFLFGIDVNY